MRTIQIICIGLLVCVSLAYAEQAGFTKLRPLFPVLRVAPADSVTSSDRETSSVSNMDLENYLYTVRQDGHDVGSAFVVKDDDGVWMISNYHVVSGSNDLEFVNIKASGKIYSLPEEVELAEDRDAFRFKINQDHGLSFAERIDFDEVVYAYGNSGGAGVVTKNKGVVAGKGNKEVEVTCDIIPGNSGGPVINASQEVVGMATYIIKPQTWKLDENVSLSSSERASLLERKSETEGTRYAETRRFAIHLAGTKWQPMSREVFQRDSKRIEDEEIAYNDFCEAALGVCHLEQPDLDVEKFLGGSWVRRYERDLEKYGRYYKGYYRVLSGKEDAFKRKYIRWIKDLASFCDKKAAVVMLEKDAVFSLYLSENLEEKIESLNLMAKGLREAADSLDG